MGNQTFPNNTTVLIINIINLGELCVSLTINKFNAMDIKINPAIICINHHEITLHVMQLIKALEKSGQIVRICINNVHFDGTKGIVDGYNDYRKKKETTNIDKDYLPLFQFQYDVLAYLKGLVEY
jgi:hypothetical protein